MPVYIVTVPISALIYKYVRADNLGHARSKVEEDDFSVCIDDGVIKTCDNKCGLLSANEPQYDKMEIELVEDDIDYDHKAWG